MFCAKSRNSDLTKLITSNLSGIYSASNSEFSENFSLFTTPTAQHNLSPAGGEQRMNISSDFGTTD